MYINVHNYFASPFQFSWLAYHGEAAFNESCRCYIRATGEAGLFAAHAYLEIARLNDNTPNICDHGELPRLKCETYNAPLPRFQMHTFYASKRSDWYSYRCLQIRHVKLDHFVTCPVAGILHGRAHCDFVGGLHAWR